MLPVPTLVFVIAAACSSPAADDDFASPAGVQKSAPSEKDARTPAQQKINSQILQEIYRRRGETKNKDVPPNPTDVRIDREGRALVDVRADVTPALEKKLRDLGSAIVSTSREYRSVIAWVPILKIEQIAADAAVRAIEPAPEPVIHK